MDNIKLMTAKEVKEYLGIGRDKCYRLMRSKSFPSTQVGDRYYVTFSALEEWCSSEKRRRY